MWRGEVEVVFLGDGGVVGSLRKMVCRGIVGNIGFTGGFLEDRMERFGMGIESKIYFVLYFSFEVELGYRNGIIWF